MMPHEAVRAAEMVFILTPDKQTWQTQREVVCLGVAGVRLQNEVLLTDPADNGHLGLWSGPLRAIWISHRELRTGTREGFSLLLGMD